MPARARRFVGPEARQPGFGFLLRQAGRGLGLFRRVRHAPTPARCAKRTTAAPAFARAAAPRGRLTGSSHRETMGAAGGRMELLPGTLEHLILRALARGPAHGYGIAQRLRERSEEVLQVGESSLYPALQRLLLQGAVNAAWGA